MNQPNKIEIEIERLEEVKGCRISVRSTEYLHTQAVHKLSEALDQKHAALARYYQAVEAYFQAKCLP